MTTQSSDAIGWQKKQSCAAAEPLSSLNRSTTAEEDPFAELFRDDRGFDEQEEQGGTADGSSSREPLEGLQRYESFGTEASAVLETYRQMRVPGPGVALTVSLPSAAPYTFCRPARDEEAECMARLGLATAFSCLSVPNFVLCFSCIVLERQVSAIGLHFPLCHHVTPLTFCRPH